MKTVHRRALLCALAFTAVLVPACAPGANPFCEAEMNTVHKLGSFSEIITITGTTQMSYCDTGASGPDRSVITGTLTTAPDGTQTLQLRRELQDWGELIKTWDYHFTLSGSDVGDGFTTGTFELGDHGTHSLSWLYRIHYPDHDHELVYESSTGALQISTLELGPADENGVVEITRFQGSYEVVYPPEGMVREERNTIRIGR